MKLIDRIKRLEQGLQIIDTYLAEEVGEYLDLERRVYLLEHKPSTIIKRRIK